MIKKGYTAAELVLVIGVFTILIGLSAPVFRSFIIKNDIDLAWNTFSHSIYRAQALARSGLADSGWGVYVGSGQIVVYQGGSYSTRNVSMDEVQTYPTGLSISGNSDFNFQRGSGNTLAPGSITFQYGGESRTSTINSLGTVDQQ